MVRLVERLSRQSEFVELTKRKKSPQRLLIGPWTHGGQAYSYSGIAEFGPEAAIDMNAVRLRWYDHWLKAWITVSKRMRQSVCL